MLLKAGDRIRVHPASDWFMRGVVYARVTSVPKDKWFVYVRAERIGPKRLRIKLAYQNILEVV